MHTISTLLHWNEVKGPPATTSTTADTKGPVTPTTITAARLDAANKDHTAPVVNPQALSTLEFYLEQSVNAAQGVSNVSRGGIRLLGLNSAIECDAAAKGTYQQQLLCAAEVLQDLGRDGIHFYQLDHAILQNLVTAEKTDRCSGRATHQYGG
jgi:hypothetical protein